LARPLRLEYPGAVWHATSRGNERGTIFRDDEDRRLFLRLLGRTSERCGWILHAYVLMGNHYHLLLETPEPTLSKGMHELNGTYSQRFNVRHERVGHLMQGRFKGILVERQTHLLELTRYVVLNPVRAGLVTMPEDWPWSNYRATAGFDRAPRWLEVEWTLSQLGREHRQAMQYYREFVCAGTGQTARPWDSIDGQIFLGGDEFRRRIRRRIEGLPISDEVPRTQRAPARPSMDQIVEATASEFGFMTANIRKRRGGDLRAIVAYLAKTEGLIPLGVIGAALLVKASRAGKLARRGQRLIDRNPSLRARVESVARKWRIAFAMDKVQT
jgi:putative transposase